MKNGRIFLLLFAAGVLTFAGSLHNPFLVDDHAFFSGQKVTLNSLIYEFIPNKHKVLGIESQATDTAYYRPLAHVIPLLSYAVFGSNTFGHHVVNLVLWVAAAFLLYLFLSRLSEEVMPSFWAALLFMVHPINGIAVNYITASIFSTMVIFMLLSVYFLVFSFHRLLPVLFFFLALMCHETAIALPFYATAALVFGQKQNWKQAFGNSLFLWLALAIYYVFRLSAHNVTTGLLQNLIQLKVNPFEYVASLAHTWAWYLTRLVYPDGIILMRVEPVIRGGMAALWFTVFVAAAVLSIWVIRRCRTGKPMVALGLVWLWIGFVPFICGAAVAPIFGLLIEPHWFMFSGIGFFMILAWIFSGRTVLAVLAATWLLTAWVYNAVWGDELTYCRQWLAYNPGFKAPLFFMGEAYMERLDFARAQFYWRQSLFNYYKDWFVYVGMGEAQALSGNFEGAKQNFLNALKWEPRAKRALGGLAKVYLKEGDLVHAQEYLERTYEADRYDAQVALTLAMLYARQGEGQKAMFMFGKANQLTPCATPVIRAWLGFAIVSNDKDQMLGLSGPISQCSSDPMSLTMAGSALGHFGYKQEAMFALRRAVAIDPNFKQAYVEIKKLH